MTLEGQPHLLTKKDCKISALIDPNRSTVSRSLNAL